jgi:hypothetical protein
VISILVVPGWRVHVSEARAAELTAAGWVVESAGMLVLTVDGARQLLALVDPAALGAISRRIEGVE